MNRPAPTWRIALSAGQRVCSTATAVALDTKARAAQGTVVQLKSSGCAVSVLKEIAAVFTPASGVRVRIRSRVDESRHVQRPAESTPTMKFTLM